MEWSLGFMLTPEEKRELLAIARECIAGALEGTTAPTRTPQSPGLLRQSGAFVTIRIDHSLRGCIGYIESVRPLAEVVCEAARKAALEDPRFPPLTPSEFEQITLEISILSPLQLVTDIEEVQVGAHGLVLELGSRRGLLLPQVALEYQWDREAFLDATAKKAGLYKNAWREPEARIYTFTAEIIQEADVLM
jgi:AmmeMemoRadiSam system protein A